MATKKVLKVTLASICVAAMVAGVGLLKVTQVSAETATTEWATGNSAVTATFNYDLASSTFKRQDGNKWSINSIDNKALVANNTAFAEKGFWTEDSYKGLNPLVYSTTAVGSAANGSTIALGYYDDDFKIACAPIQSSPSSWRSVDYMALQWKFTDIATGNYFNVCTHTYNTDNGILNIRYNAVTTKSNTYLNQASTNIGVTFKGLSGKYLVNLWFDQSTKTLYYGQDLSQSVNVEAFLTREKTATTIDTPATNFPDFKAYTVELSFDGFNWEPTYQPGKDAEHPAVSGNLAVYYLNGLETHSTTIDNLTSPGATFFQKTSEVILEDTQTVNLSDICWAWDLVEGDVTASIGATVKDPDGQDVTVTNGTFEATKDGDYTITATVGSKSKICVVNITSPTPATAEWATGNPSVTATFNYDWTNSDYSTWKFNSTDNTAMVANNEALSSKGFWTEEAYNGLKPLVYSTTAVGAAANNATISLGYYDDDFTIACAPMQSFNRGAYGWTKVDYMALQWKFTDIATGNYFNVVVDTWNSTTGALHVLYNETISNGDSTWKNNVSSNIGVAFMGKNGNNLLNLWFDKDTKTLWFGNDLSQSVNVADYLSVENFPDFAVYTVELSFKGFDWHANQPANKVDEETGNSLAVQGNLAVYYLGGLETHSVKRSSFGEWKNTVIMQSTTEVTVGAGKTLALGDIFSAWDMVKGDVSEYILYTVNGPNGSLVSLTDNAFTPSPFGTYSITAAVGDATLETALLIDIDHSISIEQLEDTMLKDSPVDLSQIISVYDTKDGDIISEADIRIYDKNGREFTKAVFDSVGTYRIVVEVDYKGVVKTAEFNILVVGSMQEWQSGNSEVQTVESYDLATSENGKFNHFAIRSNDSNVFVNNGANYTDLAGNKAREALGVWSLSSYTDLQAMLYRTVKTGAEAENASILLGEYSNVFHIAARAIQEGALNTRSSNADYDGLSFLFTDLQTGATLEIYITTKNNNTIANIYMSYNGSEYVSFGTTNYHMRGGCYGKIGNAEEGYRLPLMMYFDGENKVVRFGSGLDKICSLAEKFADFSGFENFTVDLAFRDMNASVNHSANLLVYEINNVDFTKPTSEWIAKPQILMDKKIPQEVLQGTQYSLPIVSGWDMFDGDITSLIESAITSPDGARVYSDDNVIVFDKQGTWTIEYSVMSATKGQTEIKTFEVVVLNKIPTASIELSGEIPTQYGVGGSLCLPSAEFIYQGKLSNGRIVIYYNNSFLASFDDASESHKLNLSEKGIYKIAYLYTNMHGYSNAKIYTVKSIDLIAVVDPDLPNIIDFGVNNYVVEEGKGVFGSEYYEANITITSPSGEQVVLAEDRIFRPEEIGKYKFVYSVENNGQTDRQTYFIDVQCNQKNLLIPVKNVDELIENQDVKYVKNVGLNGVAVIGSTSGTEVRFANVVDLANLNGNSIIQFQPLTVADGYAYISKVIVTLTDIYDSSNTVKIKWTRNSEAAQYTYILVNAGSNGYMGWDYNRKAVDKGEYGTTADNSFRSDIYDGKYAFNLQMDYEDREFYTYLVGGNRLLSILDADDLSHVGDGKQWGGFTTGEVYVSLSIESMTLTGGVIITSVGGQSLSGSKIIDSDSPTIFVETESEYLQSTLPDGVVGIPYPIPQAHASDLVSGNVATKLTLSYYNAQTQEWENIAVENDYFIPNATGQYKLCWRAKDVFNNEAIKEMFITVNEVSIPVSVAFEQDITDIYVGEKSYIPNIIASGGNGKVSIATKWTFNGMPVDFTAPDYYLPIKSGVLQADVTTTDYLNAEVKKTLSIQVKVPKLPVMNIANVPTSVISGGTLVLPDFSAIDYNFAETENGYYAGRKIYVNNREIDLAKLTYVVTETGGNQLTVRYEAISVNGSSIKEYTVYVLQPKYISDYLIYDSEIVGVELNASYTDFKASQDFSIRLPNPVSVNDMALSFIPDADLLGRGGVVSAIFTDFNNKAISLKISVAYNREGELCVYLNDNDGKAIKLATRADGSVYFAYKNAEKALYNSQGQKIIGADKDSNGLNFNGFESGAVILRFEITGVAKNTSFKLNQVGNQRFVTSYTGAEPINYIDRTGAQLYYEFEMYDHTVDFGDIINVSAAKAFDVLQSTATVSVTVTTPTQQVLFQDKPVDTSFSFRAEQYGYYRITYTVKSGISTNKVDVYVKVKDHTPPKIIVSGTVNGSCKVGNNLSLPNANVVDDVYEEIELFVFIVEPSGRYINVSQSYSYTPTAAGKYKVVYYAVDGDYNIAVQVYEIEVK